MKLPTLKLPRREKITPWDAPVVPRQRAAWHAAQTLWPYVGLSLIFCVFLFIFKGGKVLTPFFCATMGFNFAIWFNLVIKMGTDRSDRVLRDMERRRNELERQMQRDEDRRRMQADMARRQAEMQAAYEASKRGRW